MVSFTSEQVVEALYRGILNRAPDVEGLSNALGGLQNDPDFLPRLVENMMTSSERFDAEGVNGMVLNALYAASLGRDPDPPGAKNFTRMMQKDFRSGLFHIAKALYNSPEHQDRMLPFDPDRVIVDHSPDGEFRILLRHLLAGKTDPGTVVEVGVPRPAASFSLDFTKILNWRAVLVEGAAKHCAAIESRFSGLKFELINADVLMPDEEDHPSGDNSSTQLSRLRELGLGETSKPVLVELASVLAKAEVPEHFDLLALGAATNTMSVFDDLLASSPFRPRHVILALALPPRCTSLQQYGLTDTASKLYEVLASTQHSVVLGARRVA